MSLADFSLADKTVLVTGASSGIGRACAVFAAQMGAKLICSARKPDELAQTLAQLKPNDHQGLSCDLTDPDSLAELVSQLPTLDGMVFSAGISELVPFRMISYKHIEKIMAINFVAPVMLTQMLMKTKKINHGASLVYIGATAGRNSPVASAIYSASKAALESAVRVLALEGEKIKLRTNCIHPGYTNTPLFDKIKDSLQIPPMTSGLIEPEDVAYSAGYLLSAASRWVTRANIVIDSGVSISIR